MTELTIQAPFNDLDAVEDAFRRWGDDIACVIVEPIAGNMGFIEPLPGFLSGLRVACDRSGAILIFDEVMTGFRVARGGAQRRYRVKPDLTTLGKVMGGGLPAAAYGGRRDLMERIAPVGDVYQAGTLSGNPLAVAAGLETLRRLEEPGVYEQLEARSDELVRGLRAAAEEAGLALCAGRAGGMFGFFFHPGPVRNFEEAKRADQAHFRRFFAEMLERGVYLAPSPFEAGFVSLVHSQRDIARTVRAAQESMQRVAADR
jgi:glutamate-1-semialdehyde 2,1-aminomutase